MKWIVVAILAAIVPYTWITLHFRKAGEPYRPYEDSKQRAQVMRLLDAGYQRIALTVDRPEEAADGAPPPSHAAASPTPGGLPPELSGTLIDPPPAPEAVTGVTAPAASSAGASYPIRFTCTQPDRPGQVVEVMLYLRGREAVLVPAFEALDDERRGRDGEMTARVVLPAGTLATGSYRFTLVGARTSRVWTVEVR